MDSPYRNLSLSPNLAKPFLLDPVQGDVIGERGIKTENIAAVPSLLSAPNMAI